MTVVYTKEDLKAELLKLNKNIGFVPTMGYLHNGHKSLIEKSKSENEYTVVSIFVNPAQFLPNEDLDKYPRNKEGDIKFCEDLGVDILFMPKDVYFDYEPKVIAPKELASILEGATRPGHFDGVLTVLNKFFNLVKPKNAYFGKKDTQQLMVINNMIKSFFMNINIVPCEIIREEDGLALSSRNSYLDEEQRVMALKIFRSLTKAKNMIENGELDSNLIQKEMRGILEPLKIDYIEFVDKEFNKIDKIKLGESIILIAVYVGPTRLIDNIWI
ncbi:pantothenate synthetase [Campylobacter blaseri]|uniref:Pantothenate synthetase n=1 Tax=Campylobacter blaseri TaxID=2042961 RepID=A0A2P8R1D1_9BACT|nr:pantoate--beta-alanine ligase [Campylobacter blaseri]PSM52305.1 pantoate--beta-alanine ligase [Campylobacter blaseri]PSM54071.1 pantoate--beta-alanine ligase [Campylobacter blaseri]QKF85513.1 pantothenate synthetase [Campylobacter blaseri]